MLTAVFWESVAETVVGYAAAGAGSILTLHGVAVVKDIPWYAVLSGAGVGGLIGFCKAMGSLKIQPDNGTDSFNSQVVAKGTE